MLSFVAKNERFFFPYFIFYLILYCMSTELKNFKSDIVDKLAVNALSVGFSGKLSYDEIKKNLTKILKQIPLTCSRLVDKKGFYSLEPIDSPFINFSQTKLSEKVWISRQMEKPFDMFNGEFIRFGLLGDNNLIIYAHPIISDSRGLIALAKAILDKDYEYNSESFYFPSIEDTKLSLLNKIKFNKLKKISKNEEKDQCKSVRVKTVSLKSDIIYALCSSEGVSMLSFFIITALSLSKVDRKKINIPFCKKDNFDDLLINDSPIFSFKRGLEPRLSFYDNCEQLDKYLVSVKSKKPYEQRKLLLSLLSDENNNPFMNENLFKYLFANMQFDILPQLNEDSVVKTMNFYNSSSFTSTSFGICAVDDRITISAILHDDEGEKLFSDYQATVNLLAKNASKKFRKK